MSACGPSPCSSAVRASCTPRGNPPDNRFIDYILHNPLYVGKLRWSTNGRAASRREFDSDTFMIVPGKHEAIIDQQTFDRAQELIAEQKRHYRPYTRVDHPAEWMLKGLVRCDTCGATLIRSNYKSEAAPRLFAVPQLCPRLLHRLARLISAPCQCLCHRVSGASRFRG